MHHVLVIAPLENGEAAVLRGHEGHGIPLIVHELRGRQMARAAQLAGRDHGGGAALDRLGERDPLHRGAAATPVEDTTKKKKSRKVEPAAPTPVETQAIGPSDQPVAAPIQTETPPASADAADPNAAAKKKKRSKARQQDQESAPAPAAPAPGGAL